MPHLGPIQVRVTAVGEDGLIYTRTHEAGSCFYISANNDEIQMTTTSAVPHSVAPFVRTSVRAAYGDGWTEHQDFSRTKLLRVEVGAGLCCHGFRYALVPGRGGGSAGGIRQGQHSTVGVSTSFRVNYIRVFVARFNTWTRAWLRSSQPSTSALWCSVKTCLSSVYRASCIEATLYDPRIPSPPTEFSFALNLY